MCNKRSSRKLEIYRHKGKYVELFKTCKVDSCMLNLIYVLNMKGIKTLGCCCGHGKYNMSIIHQSPNGKIWDLISGVEIPRKTRFYLTDDEGYYYIPELS